MAPHAALAEIGVEYELVEIDRETAQTDPDYLALNPNGVVPTLVDDSGRTVRLLGVNRSGAEYACIQGWGIFDGPVDAASIRAIASWHANAVRVPLNEDCWLGIDGVKKRYGGAAYRRAIVGYVRLLHEHGMYVELSLI